MMNVVFAVDAHGNCSSMTHACARTVALHVIRAITVFGLSSAHRQLAEIPAAPWGDRAGRS
jgi:hypothetical protein